MLLANRTNDFFDDFFNTPFFRRDVSFETPHTMKTDVKEKDGNYLVDMELPGFSKEEIQADIKDGYLTIHAEHEESKDEKDDEDNFLRRERYSGTCSRTFYVGEEISVDDINACFKDGILKLEIPKEPAKQPEERKLITIQ